MLLWELQWLHLSKLCRSPRWWVLRQKRPPRPGHRRCQKRNKGPLAAGKAVDVSTLVGRLRTSYPVLRATAVDSALRQLLLAELVSQCYREGGAVVLPRNLRVHAVDEDRFVEFKNELSGLNAENVAAVQQKLV